MRNAETPQESLDRLSVEVEELRASRERLVRAADDERRRIERELHDGPQQHLVGLAVNLELARGLADSDPAAVKERLDEMGRDVRRALDEAARLAHRIYPPLLETGGLGTALRTAAAAAGVPIRLEVAVGGGWPLEVAGAVYFCCLHAFESLADVGASLTVTVREEAGALAFAVAHDEARSGVASTAKLEVMRDRVEALGGGLEVGSDPEHGTWISGSLPLSR